MQNLVLLKSFISNSIFWTQAVEGGCLDPAVTEPYGRSRAEQEGKTARRNTEHHLGHRRRHGGKQPVC
jgi:hypothetical protein